MGMFLDVLLGTVLIFFLSAHYLRIVPLPELLFAVLSFVGLLPVLISAIRALINKKLTVDLLASIALVVSLLARDWYSASFINLMLVFARIFDAWTEHNSRQILAKLLKYRPESVKVQKEGRVLELSLDQVKVGDLIVVESGERIAVDGVVTSGQASVNQATLTGESEPVAKHVGDKVFTSTLNESGSLVVRIEKIGEDTRFSQIVKLVEEASRAKSTSEKIADRFTQWYILASLVAAILVYLISHNMELVLGMLLVVCADDIAVSIPLSFTAAISKAAQKGILVKGSQVLEKLSQIKYFVTDKTGTITYGRPQIKQIEVYSRLGKTKILQLLGSACLNSSHPVSKATIKYLKSQNITFKTPDDFLETPGEGMVVVCGKQRLYCGKLEFLTQHKFVVTKTQQDLIDQVRDRGDSITVLGSAGKILGIMVFTDQIRPLAHQVIAKTKQLGVAMWIMLTGDNAKTAAQVCEHVGIDKFESNVSPEGKFKFLQTFKHDHPGVIAMMGDGVNDAAALALADVSIAMGLVGSDAAFEASDMAITNDSLAKIPLAMELSRKTLTVVKQNFWIWGITNIIGLVLVFSGVLAPVGASTYNFATDFLPIFNALRLLWF